MSDQSTLRTIAEHIARIFEPLIDAFEDDEAFQDFLLRLGWQAGNRPGSFVTVGSAIAAAVEQVAALADNPEPDDIFKALGAVRNVYTGLRQADVPSGIQATAEEIAVAIVELLLGDYLAATTPRLYQALRITGVIRQEEQPDQAGRAAYVRTTIDWARIVAVAEDPKKISQGLYRWGSTDFEFDLFIENLGEILQALRFRPRFEFVTDSERIGYAPTGGPLDSAIEKKLVFPLASAVLDADIVEARLSVLELPSRGAEPPGIIVELGLPPIPGQIPLGTSLKLEIARDPALDGPAGVYVRPGLPLAFRSPLGTGTDISAPKVVPTLTFAPAEPLLLLGRPSATRLQLGGASLSVALRDGPDLVVEFAPKDLALILSGDNDGLVSSFLGSGSSIKIETGLRWSSKTGISFLGRADLRLDLPLTLTLGAIHVDRLVIEVKKSASASTDGFDLAIAGSFGAALGPVSVEVTDVGARLTFSNTPGRMGPFDIDAGLKPPTGLGLSINAGSVSGGGFISFDPEKGRYFGALELSVYGVAVKAFGIIETKVPGVSYSFLIIISADFTPVQLGLGFTLNGVGGLAGINRTVDQKGLLEAVRGGRIETALFPHDVVHDAPAIIHDVGVLFPPASGHYVFGPLAKIGWGTPTLVEADLGLILEFPGPRLVVLGTVHAALPTKEEPLVELNLDVAGLIDFPKKYFSLDASLHDSRVGDFPISGDMAMRLTWGPNPNFALAVGGFNPHYNPPPSFPKLRPVTVDLGQHGNPSINLHGYMALTSNTAQVGAQLEARVSGGGAELYGFLGFDALFVFSPFSFMADIEGGVKVSFHGHGFSLHFHGHISGPSPWHLDGKVCVSILFWDACVGFSVNLGGASRAALPGLDPWTGKDANGVQRVLGLEAALKDPKNWAGGTPPSSTNVVTLVAAPPGTAAPVDPLGSATVRQKAVPLDVPITRFAGTKPLATHNFHISQITIGQTAAPGQNPQTTANVATPDTVSDFFAPAEFQAMKDADKLSSASFVQMAAGVTFSSDAIKAGPVKLRDLTYHTIVFNADGTQSANDGYSPSSAQVTSTTAISAVALSGIRAAALARYLDPTGKPKVTLNANADGYVLSSTTTLKVAAGFSLAKPVPRPAAVGALLAQKLIDPTAAQTLQITPVFNALP